jgi:hypothetical protein
MVVLEINALCKNEDPGTKRRGTKRPVSIITSKRNARLALRAIPTDPAPCKITCSMACSIPTAPARPELVLAASFRSKSRHASANPSLSTSWLGLGTTHGKMQYLVMI